MEGVVMKKIAIIIGCLVLFACISGCDLLLPEDTAATPTFSPSAGTYPKDQEVTISSATAGATIYYTTDGTGPTTSSEVYTLPISVAGNCTSVTIKAMAVKEGMTDSAIATAAYTVSYTASGGELIWGGASSNGIDVNASAGLQGRMIGETAPASCAIGTDKANEIINKLFSDFEDDLPTAPKGKTFPECYDLVTLEPTREYSDLYARTKERLSSDFGIDYAD